MIVGPRLPGPLQPVDEKPDRVVVFGVNLHERTGFPGHRQHLEDLKIAQRKVCVGHEDLQRGVTVGHQGRQLLPQHIFRRIGDD